MLSHEKVWAAIDALARQNGLSPSGLARRAGLDPTTFNRSKRITGDGRPRWPSTESLAKILDATGERLHRFAERVEADTNTEESASSPLPITGFAEAAAPATFDGKGRSDGSGWPPFDHPPTKTDGEFALEVRGDAWQPLYRDGDVLIAAPAAPARRGDRLLVKLREVDLQVFLLFRRTRSHYEFRTIGENPETLVHEHSEIEWTARIIWASQ